MVTEREYEMMQLQEVRVPASYKRQVIPMLCPVCRKAFLSYITRGGERNFAALVAVSNQWETAEGEDLYLVTCAEHSLADVFAQRRWNERI